MPLHLRSRRNTPLELMMESVLPVAGPFFAVGSRVRRLSVKDRHKPKRGAIPGGTRDHEGTYMVLFFFFRARSLSGTNIRPACEQSVPGTGCKRTNPPLFYFVFWIPRMRER